MQMQKLLTFFSKYISLYAIFNDQAFNDMLINDIVSFEQLGPGKDKAMTMQTPHITKTCLYNFDPLKPHFYIVKLGFIGVCIIFLIYAQKHRLGVLVRTASSRRF